MLYRNNEWFTRRRRDGTEAAISFDRAKQIAVNFWI